MRIALPALRAARSSHSPARYLTPRSGLGISTRSWPDATARSKMEDDIAERFEQQGRGGSRGRGGGRRGRGGGGGGGGKSDRGRDSELSHALSKLLRHQAENAGIKLDKEGYAPLDRVLQWGPIRTLAPSFGEIQAAVRDSDKQRFKLKPGPEAGLSADGECASTAPSDWLIRANQGHSIQLETNDHLTPLAVPLQGGGGGGGGAEGELPPGTAAIPPVVVHGTYYAFWPRIVESGGLKLMGRTHVHFSLGLPEDAAGVVSGMRRDAELLVYVDVARSMAEGGIKWWVSQNGVVLTDGDEQGTVPLRYFREVVGRKAEVGLLWKDGEKVADLPDGLEIRVPVGKDRTGNRGSRGGRGRGRGK